MRSSADERIISWLRKKERTRPTINFTILVYIKTWISSRAPSKIPKSEPTRSLFQCAIARIHHGLITLYHTVYVRSLSAGFAALLLIYDTFFSRGRDRARANWLVSAISRVQRSHFLNLFPEAIRMLTAAFLGLSRNQPG